MTGQRRVVFDSSTLVSAALRRLSTPRQALLQALDVCEVCASAETLAEVEEVLSRRKFDRYLDQEQRQAFVVKLRQEVSLFVVEYGDAAAVEPPCRDATDNKFLALALAAEADAIVSSDEDLLVLHPWRGIPILTPGEFLAGGVGSRS
jgi:hypothetical protein